jgi:hypothetical protein
MTRTSSHFVTNDGVRLVYEVADVASASASSPIVFVHGSKP